jgi:hypothetical protein
MAVSPELALVDPATRARALEALPALEPFDFLRRDEPRRHPALDDFGFLGDYDDEETFKRAPNLVVAAAAYAAGAIARTVAFEAAVFAAVALVVLVLNLIALSA